MESLFAYSYLWAWGFCSVQEYNEHLDNLFSITPNNLVLLELEECSENYKDTFARLKRYFEYEINTFNTDKFGQVLFKGLEKAYRSGVYDIAYFGKKCYEMWRLLPEFLGHEQPFFVLCYANDPLSWGDKNQTCELYESAFTFYER